MLRTPKAIRCVACRCSRVACLAVTLWLLAAGPVWAWTDTRIAGLVADLDVEGTGLMTVRLRMKLHVRGGWLSRLSLPGLDSDLALVPAHTRFVADDGSDYEPTVERDEGTLVLRFPDRRRAPRVGHYGLSLSYNTGRIFAEATRPDAGYARLRWRLPPWENGLENVIIRVTAPRGTLAVPPASPGAQLEVATYAQHGSTVLHFHRANLPRTTPLDIVFDVPAAALAPALRPAASGLARPVPLLRAAPPQRPKAPFFGPPLWLCLAAIALSKLSLSALGARKQRRQRRFLLPGLGLPGRALSVLACAAVGCWLAAAQEAAVACGAVLIALVLERRGERLPLPATARAQVARPAEIRALRLQRLLEHFDAAAFMDVTTLAGALVLTALWALCAAALPLVGHGPRVAAFAVLASLPWWSGTRRLQHPSVAQTVHTLSQLGAALKAPPPELVLYHADHGGSPCDARLRLPVSAAANGLLEANLVLGEHNWLDRCLATPCWLLVVEADSEADRKAARALPGIRPARSPDGARRAYLAPAASIAEEAAALRAWLHHRSVPRPRHRAAA